MTLEAVTRARNNTAYLSLGSNIEPRLERLNTCKLQLDMISGITVAALSSVYETTPIGMSAETPAFLNQVLCIQTSLSPEKLLEKTEALELTLGRTEKGRKQSRTIDIDILLFGERKINTPRLVVPHPQLHLRAFALIPLLELDKTLKNPNTGQPYCQALDNDLAGMITKIDAQARMTV